MVGRTCDERRCPDRRSGRPFTVSRNRSLVVRSVSIARCSEPATPRSAMTDGAADAIDQVTLWPRCCHAFHRARPERWDTRPHQHQKGQRPLKGWAGALFNSGKSHKSRGQGRRLPTPTNVPVEDAHRDSLRSSIRRKLPVGF